MPKFKDKSKKNAPKQQTQEFTRVRTPRNDEIIGIVEQRVGANRMIVKCFDDKERNCRIYMYVCLVHKFSHVQRLC